MIIVKKNIFSFIVILLINYNYQILADTEMSDKNDRAVLIESRASLIKKNTTSLGYNIKEDTILKLANSSVHLSEERIMKLIEEANNNFIKSVNEKRESSIYGFEKKLENIFNMSQKIDTVLHRNNKEAIIVSLTSSVIIVFLYNIFINKKLIPVSPYSISDNAWLLKNRESVDFGKSQVNKAFRRLKVRSSKPDLKNESAIKEEFSSI